MRLDRRQCGAAVETAACELLRAAGLVELAANAYFRGGELDLVMRDGEAVVFVEVRYRRNAAFGGGAASVDARTTGVRIGGQKAPACIASRP